MKVLQVISNNFRNNLHSKKLIKGQQTSRVGLIMQFVLILTLKFWQTATNHIQLLIDSSTDIGSAKQNKSFAVPCLFTTFEQLISNSSQLETNRDVFTKLKLDVDFNDKTGE